MSSSTASQTRIEINNRIYDRNVPSAPLQPYLDVRPVSTKYSILPVVDPRKPVTTPLTVQPIYNVQRTFNPGNATAPFSGYASEINTESQLKNQIYALQRSSQAIYIPNSDSDLYTEPNIQSSNKNGPQLFPGLFETPTFQKHDPKPVNIKHQTLFYANTGARSSTNK